MVKRGGFNPSYSLDDKDTLNRKLGVAINVLRKIRSCHKHSLPGGTQQQHCGECVLYTKALDALDFIIYGYERKNDGT